MPAFLPPALASPAMTPPDGISWGHEIKFDGYRIQAALAAGKARLSTRKGLDWTRRFGSLAERLAALPAETAVIDGEAVVEGPDGVTRFSALVDALKGGRGRIGYMAFDLLHLDGRDLTGLPLAERKDLLRALIGSAPGSDIRYSEHIIGSGAAMLAEACRLGLEGIVSKRLDKPYRSGRSGDWRKIKCSMTETFVIAGYTLSSAGNEAIGALLLGAYAGGALVYVGRVGTGFTAALAYDLRTALHGLQRKSCPFAHQLTAAQRRGVRWVEPKLIADVEFRATTPDRLLRHAVFKGLREDMGPLDAVLPDVLRFPPPTPPDTAE